MIDLIIFLLGVGNVLMVAYFCKDKKHSNDKKNYNGNEKDINDLFKDKFTYYRQKQNLN